MTICDSGNCKTHNKEPVWYKQLSGYIKRDQLRSTERIVRTIEFLIAKAIVNPDRDPLNRVDNEDQATD